MTWMNIARAYESGWTPPSRPSGEYRMSDGITRNARQLYISERNVNKLSIKTIKSRLWAGERDIVGIFERRAAMPLVGSAAK